MAASPLAKKYEALNLRERALVVLAILGRCHRDRLGRAVHGAAAPDARARSNAELANASAFGVDAQSADRQRSAPGVDQNAPANCRRSCRISTRSIANTASGFVSSQRMIEVLHDVLDRQGRLELVSIRNLPVVSLAPPRVADRRRHGCGADAAHGRAGLACRRSCTPSKS